MIGRSYAVTALLLTMLEERPGQWLEVDDLALRLLLDRELVRSHLEPLACQAQVQVQRLDRGSAPGPISAARIPGQEGPSDASRPLPQPPAAFAGVQSRSLAERGRLVPRVAPAAAYPVHTLPISASIEGVFHVHG